MSSQTDLDCILQQVFSLAKDSELEKALKKTNVRSLEDWFDLQDADLGRVAHDDDSSGSIVEVKLLISDVNKV